MEMLAFLTKRKKKEKIILAVFREAELLYTEQNKLIFWCTVLNVTSTKLLFPIILFQLELLF